MRVCRPRLVSVISCLYVSPTRWLLRRKRRLSHSLAVYVFQFGRKTFRSIIKTLMLIIVFIHCVFLIQVSLMQTKKSAINFFFPSLLLILTDYQLVPRAVLSCPLLCLTHMQINIPSALTRTSSPAIHPFNTSGLTEETTLNSQPFCLLQ